MSVKKSIEEKREIPINLAYELLKQIGRDNGWKVLEENQDSLILKWQLRSRVTVKVIVTAQLKSLGQYTQINLLGEIPGLTLVDSGNIPNAWDKLMIPFDELVEITKNSINEGRMCPNCGKILAPGTKFCPNDGTIISATCSECGYVNSPDASFCSNCGSKF